LELARSLGAPDREKSFLQTLEQGRSNRPDQGTLRDLYLQTNA
jgi:hypothetical protein